MRVLILSLIISLVACSTSRVKVEERDPAADASPKVQLAAIVASSPQMDLEDTSQCSTMFSKATSTGRHVYLSTISALTFGDEPSYSESDAGNGINCFKLLNKGSNDGLWAAGAPRAPGCVCGTLAR